MQMQSGSKLSLLYVIYEQIANNMSKGHTIFHVLTKIVAEIL